MRRRALLATVAALGGCLGAPTAGSPPTDTGTPASAGTDSPRCPPAPESETTVRCTDADASAGIRTTASPASLSLPRDTCRFVFHNGAEQSVTTTPGAYQLFAYANGSWEFVVPKVLGGVGHDPVELPPGASREWTLHVNTADLGSVRPPDGTGGERSLTLRLPPGTYAFGVRATPTGRETPRLYATRFTVSGETPPLVPSDRVVSHARRGGTLTVTTGTEMEYGNSHRVTLLLDRRSETARTADLSLFELYNPGYEQVPSYDSVFVDPLLAPLLRDGFAFAEAADERIRVRTVDTTRPPLGMSEGESLAVAYGGERWRLTTRRGWE